MLAAANDASEPRASEVVVRVWGKCWRADTATRPARAWNRALRATKSVSLLSCGRGGGAEGDKKGVKNDVHGECEGGTAQEERPGGGGEGKKVAQRQRANGRVRFPHPS